MFVLAWNSQGKKKDFLYEEVLPVLNQNGVTHVLIYICEAGNWGKGSASKNDYIDINETTTVNNIKYHIKGKWVGWKAAEADSEGNKRCSVAMLEVRQNSIFQWSVKYFSSKSNSDSKGNIRPIMFAQRNFLRIYGLHTVSNQFASAKELDGTGFDMYNEGKTFASVGDMNYTLKSKANNNGQNIVTNNPFKDLGIYFNVDPSFFWTGEGTQRSGNQLDWGFGVNVKGNIPVICMGVTNTKFGNNYVGSPGVLKSPSDHASLLYMFH